ncbi:hypothetical protein [Streptomyces microflavus]|uniref:hypothetical protein n=1 Tax=Streptomyces microflavus TaxID=1919 RepID=UPI0036F09920
MAKWWKFGFGKDKDQEQGPAPEQAPAPTPTPAPAPAPEPSAGPEGGGEKKRGLLGRLFGRGKGKKEKAPAPAPEAPPAAPPTAPPSAPPAAPPSAPAEGGEEAGDGEGPAGPAKPEERSFPSSIDATADGDWRISQNDWYGQMNATLSGNKVKEFILAYEANNWTRCAQLVADGWNMPVASQIDTAASNIENISWS